MRYMKYSFRIACIMLMSLFVLTGCNGTKDNTPMEVKETATPTPSVEAVVTEVVKDDSAIEIVEEAVPEVDPNYDPNFELILEAEEATFTGKLRVENTKQGFSGTGYLNGFESDADIITFMITVPGTGAYDLNFISAGNTGHKENNILVDGINIGIAKVELNEFTDSIMERVYLSVGEHQIKMTKNWGWILLDSLKVTASAPADTTIYEVASNLVDPKATDRAKKLMQYMTDMYGEYVISGQYGDKGIDGSEFKAIQKASGEYPAMLGLDLIEYTPSRVENGSVGKDIEYALKFDQEGGIVTFCWHWNAPEPYLIDSSENPWWRGFYTDGTTIDLKKIMDGEDKEGYDLLIRDIDAIAEQLKKLQAEDIPILWRPLHEASGGWFWWGAKGPEAYIQLYKFMFDRLTNHHNIHNLIWVWNGQNKDWYPGDEYVDIVGTDIYPGEKVYTAQADRFSELVKWNGDNKKIVAMTENGCMFDPELATRDNAMWSYFGTWEGEFLTVNNTYTLSEKYTETDMLVKVYTSDKVITLDELPDLKTYGN